MFLFRAGSQILKNFLWVSILFVMLVVGLRARQDLTSSSAVIMDLNLVMDARHRCALPAVISAQGSRLVSDAFGPATFQLVALRVDVQIVSRNINLFLIRLATACLGVSINVVNVRHNLKWSAYVVNVQENLQVAVRMSSLSLYLPKYTPLSKSSAHSSLA